LVLQVAVVLLLSFSSLVSPQILLPVVLLVLSTLDYLLSVLVVLAF